MSTFALLPIDPAGPLGSGDRLRFRAVVGVKNDHLSWHFSWSPSRLALRVGRSLGPVPASPGRGRQPARGPRPRWTLAPRGEWRARRSPAGGLSRGSGAGREPGTPGGRGTGRKPATSRRAAVEGRRGPPRRQPGSPRTTGRRRRYRGTRPSLVRRRPPVRPPTASGPGPARRNKGAHRRVRARGPPSLCASRAPGAAGVVLAVGGERRRGATRLAAVPPQHGGPVDEVVGRRLARRRVAPVPGAPRRPPQAQGPRVPRVARRVPRRTLPAQGPGASARPPGKGVATSRHSSAPAGYRS